MMMVHMTCILSTAAPCSSGSASACSGFYTGSNCVAWLWFMLQEESEWQLPAFRESVQNHHHRTTKPCKLLAHSPRVSRKQHPRALLQVCPTSTGAGPFPPSDAVHLAHVQASVQALLLSVTHQLSAQNNTPASGVCARSPQAS
jgi:hypothetical protein